MVQNLSLTIMGGVNERQSLVTLEVANFKGMMEGVRGGGLGH